MFRILDGRRLRKPANRFRQQLRVVRDLDPLWDFRFRQWMSLRALCVDDRILVFHLLPLERLLRPVGIEAFTILSRGGEQTARHFAADIRITQLERRRLNRERAAILRDQRFIDSAGAVADDVLGVLAEKREARTDAVRRVMHRRKALPIAWPSVHILLMTSAKELNPAQFP